MSNKNTFFNDIAMFKLDNEQYVSESVIRIQVEPGIFSERQVKHIIPSELFLKSIVEPEKGGFVQKLANKLSGNSLENRFKNTGVMVSFSGKGQLDEVNSDNGEIQITYHKVDDLKINPEDIDTPLSYSSDIFNKVNPTSSSGPKFNQSIKDLGYVTGSGNVDFRKCVKKLDAMGLTDKRVFTASEYAKTEILWLNYKESFQQGSIFVTGSPKGHSEVKVAAKFLELDNKVQKMRFAIQENVEILILENDAATLASLSGESRTPVLDYTQDLTTNERESPLRVSMDYGKMFEKIEEHKLMSEFVEKVKDFTEYPDDFVRHGIDNYMHLVTANSFYDDEDWILFAPYGLEAQMNKDMDTHKELFQRFNDSLEDVFIKAMELDNRADEKLIDRDLKNTNLHEQKYNMDTNRNDSKANFEERLNKETTKSSEKVSENELSGPDL
jgi:hypothetical protein